MNKGPWGGRGCRVPKVWWCGRLECQFSAFWQYDPVSLFSQGEGLFCKLYGTLERINSGLLCVETGSGVDG